MSLYLANMIGWGVRGSGNMHMVENIMGNKVILVSIVEDDDSKLICYLEIVSNNEV
jgi:hypothetical protein